MPATLKRVKVQMLDELLTELGGIDPSRICLEPPPGHATEKDVIRYLHQPDKRIFELVKRTLVEKPMGLKESFLAAEIARFLRQFALEQGDIGFATGPDGGFKLFGGLIRFPDVSFLFWDQLPNRLLPAEPVPTLAPDIAVEVLSESNTPKEIALKRAQYFKAGVRLLWIIDPTARTVQVFTSPKEHMELTEADSLDGGEVMPGFRLPLAELFAKLPPEPKKPTRRKK